MPNKQKLQTATESDRNELEAYLKGISFDDLSRVERGVAKEKGRRETHRNDAVKLIRDLASQFNFGVTIKGTEAPVATTAAVENNSHDTRYSREFRVRAAKRLIAGVPISTVSHDTGVSKITLYQWKYQVAKNGDKAFPGVAYKEHLKTNSRKVYSLDLKVKAVRRYVGGERAHDIAKDLGIREALIRRWKYDLQRSDQQSQAAEASVTA